MQRILLLALAAGSAAAQTPLTVGEAVRTALRQNPAMRAAAAAGSAAGERTRQAQGGRLP